MVLRGLDQRAGVLGEARTAEAGAGMQKLRSDAVVEPDAARDFLHVGAKLLGQVSNLVDECNLGGEKSVRRILDQLCGTAISEHQGTLIER